MEAKPAPPTINPVCLDIKKDEIKLLDNIPLIISNDGTFLKFRATIPDDFLKKEYELVVSLEQLKEINNYFKVFKDLNEVYSCLFNEYNNGRISFKINESEIKIIILNTILNSEFELSIPRQETLSNPLEIYHILFEMQKRIKSLESENKNLKKQVEENKNKINFLENYLKIYNSTPFFESTPEKRNLNFFKGSNIINNENDVNLLISFLPQKPSITSILFNSMIHGDSMENFQNKVTNKSPTYIIIKTQKNRIFGGYTTHTLNEKNNDIFQDTNSFVFSLDNKKEYKIKNVSNAIVERETHIQFGTCYFRINNNCTKKKIWRKIAINKPTICLCRENNFLVKSYEVFLIEY